MSTQTILIVEDNLLVATSLRIILETSGHQVLPFARSGARALELAVAHSPDLVLMDINLEGELDGIDTASRLKGRARYPRGVYIRLYGRGDVAASGIDGPTRLYQEAVWSGRRSKGYKRGSIQGLDGRS